MELADILNRWDEFGVFDYVIPFLLIFAVVFGILQKAKIFGDSSDEKQKNVKGINAVIAAAIGLLALQFNLVSSFFEVIFPRFGVGLAVFLVLVIAVGFFAKDEDERNKNIGWVGWIVGLGAVIWAWDSWDHWTSSGSFIVWIQDWFWAIIVILIIVGGIGAILGGSD